MQPIESHSRRRNRLDSRACRKRELRSLRRELRETLEQVQKWQAEIREDATQCAVAIVAAGAAMLGGFQIATMFAALWGGAVALAILARTAKIRIALLRAPEIDRNITNMQASLVRPESSCALLARQKLG